MIFEHPVLGAALWGLVEARAQATPDARMAIDEDDRALSFAGYRRACEEVAAGFLERGYGPGTPISWALPTWNETLVLCGALARLGAVQNPILPIYRHREVGFCTRQTGARLLVVPPEWRGFDYAAMARELAAEHGRARDGAGMDVLVVERGAPGGASHTALPTGDPATLPSASETADADAVRWIFYTSGTTADPKGAKHSDRTLHASTRGMVEAYEVAPDDRVALVFPFTHIGGVAWLLGSLMAGCSLLTVAQFTPAETIPLLAKRGVTVAGAGTAFHLAYLDAQRERGAAPLFPRVRVFPGGGAPKPLQLHADLKAAFGGAGCVSGYGMTECPIVASNTIRCGDEKLARTEGRPSPAGAQWRVVALDGSEAAAGEEGELRVKGPQLFHGYLDPALDGAAFDEQGFFRTGDLAIVDAEGYVEITGRLKDVIIRNGENISAKEIEDLLYEHPKVADVAVVGLSHPRTGEQACAVVALRSAEGALVLEEMVEFLASKRLMKQKIPERLEVVDEIPRNAAGKIMKNRLRERYGPPQG